MYHTLTGLGLSGYLLTQGLQGSGFWALRGLGCPGPNQKGDLSVVEGVCKLQEAKPYERVLKGFRGPFESFDSGLEGTCEVQHTPCIARQGLLVLSPSVMMGHWSRSQGLIKS